MGSKIILTDREETSSFEAKAQLDFILSFLHQSGIPRKKLLPCTVTDNQFFSVENKILLRKICDQEQISIVDDTNGGLKIYIKSDNQNILVAEWYKPIHILQIDPKHKKILVQIHIHWWTIFEEEE